MTLMKDPSSWDTILEIKDLFVRFSSVVGTTRAVNGASLDVRRGEILGLVGESGCGKSVTARSIVGLVPSPPGVYEGGEIWLETRAGRVNALDLRRDERKMRQIRGKEVSMIFQEPMRSLHPMMKVGDQVVEGILEHELADEAKAFDRTVDLFDMVGLPQPRELLERYPHELSGGMRQRVMIALALSCQPQLLIADEPTTSLDVTIQAQILDLIMRLRERLGMSVLLITHNMGVVASTADRVSVMYLGDIVETGTVHEVFEEPAHPYTQGLLQSIPSLFSEPKTHLRSLAGVVPELSAPPTGCVFMDRCPHFGESCEQKHELVAISAEHKVLCGRYASPRVHAGANPDWVRQSESRLSEVAQETPPVHGPIGTAADASGLPSDTEDSIQIQVRGLELHYPVFRGVFRRRVGTVRAVDGVELSVSSGEVLGLVGESGCGKTSVGRAITRLVDPTGGEVAFRANGTLQDITHLPQKEMKEVRRHMGMVFQDPLSSLNPRMNVRSIIGEPLMIHGIAKGREVDNRVGELLEMVGLRARHQVRFPHAFSGGQRQRIAIARALAVEPRFVVADEPVSSLDVSVQSQVLNLLMDLQQEMHLAMLFIAHDIAVVRHISDRIAVMYLGKIVEVGSAKSVCSYPVHPYTEGLLASIPLPKPGSRSTRQIVKGDVPDPSNPPKGCRFHTRCPYVQPLCEAEEPMLRSLQGSADRIGACHFQDDLQLSGVGELA